jgi:hypothetical protein
VSDAKATASNGGIGTLGALLVLFVGLKLGHVIDWPWLWVLAPAWGPFALVLGALGGIGVFLAGLWAYGEAQEWRAARRKAVRP